MYYYVTKVRILSLTLRCVLVSPGSLAKNLETCGVSDVCCRCVARSLRLHIVNCDCEQCGILGKMRFD